MLHNHKLGDQLTPLNEPLLVIQAQGRTLLLCSWIPDRTKSLKDSEKFAVCMTVDCIAHALKDPQKSTPFNALSSLYEDSNEMMWNPSPNLLNISGIME